MAKEQTSVAANPRWNEPWHLANKKPPIGEVVECKCDGEWEGACATWDGASWYNNSAPRWARDMDSLLPMLAPSHWRFLWGRA